MDDDCEDKQQIKVNEKYDAHFIVQRLMKKKSLNVLSSYAGAQAGPGVYLENNRGKTTGAGYCLWILPTVVGFMRLHARNDLSLEFMQRTLLFTPQQLRRIIKRYMRWMLDINYMKLDS